jgi:hypothetical protein
MHTKGGFLAFFDQAGKRSFFDKKSTEFFNEIFRKNVSKNQQKKLGGIGSKI